MAETFVETKRAVVGYGFPFHVKDEVLEQFIREHEYDFVMSENEENLFERLGTVPVSELFREYTEDGNDHAAGPGAAVVNIMNRHTEYGFSLQSGSPELDVPIIMLEASFPWNFSKRYMKNITKEEFETTVIQFMKELGVPEDTLRLYSVTYNCGNKPENDVKKTVRRDIIRRFKEGLKDCYAKNFNEIGKSCISFELDAPWLLPGDSIALEITSGFLGEDEKCDFDYVSFVVPESWLKDFLMKQLDEGVVSNPILTPRDDDYFTDDYLDNWFHTYLSEDSLSVFEAAIAEGKITSLKFH